MNNQAAQTMPEIPQPSIIGAYYVAADMESYGRACYAAAISQTAGVPDITVEMWEAGRAAYANWIFRTYRQGMPTEEDRDESARIAIAAMRAAAPAASGGEGGIRDAYEGAREDLLDWKGRALRAEATLRGLGYTGICADEAPQSPAAASVSERARSSMKLLRFGRGNGYTPWILEPHIDGYWTPWHTAQSELDMAVESSTQLERALEQALTQQRGEPVEMSPEFTDSARGAIAWVLYHHQGGSSPVGQPLRFALGMGAHEDLSDEQISNAKVYAELTGRTTAEFHAARATPQPGAEALRTVIASMSNFADVADQCELTEHNAQVAIRSWMTQLESLLARGGK